MTQSFVTRILIILTVVAVVIGIGNITTRRAHTTQATDSSPSHTLTATQKSTLTTLSAPTIEPRIKPTTNPAVYAKAYIALDPTTHYPLIEKNADMPVPIASTTKIMTALVALETYDLDRIITIPREAAAIEGSEIQLMTGETMTVKNLLYALLVKSANDGAMALALADGNKDAFITKMNAKATMLGLTNTRYNDPAGLDDGGYSSARDLATLARYALTNKVFRDIVQTSKYTIWSSDNRYKHDLVNSNRLVVPEEALYLPSAIGLKTGFTEGAGHCLVSAVKLDDNRFLIAVVLNTVENTNPASAKESRKLLIWAQHVLNKV